MQRCLFNLHRRFFFLDNRAGQTRTEQHRLFPIDVIRSKAQEYVDASLCDHNAAQVMVRTIEAERGGENIFNERHGVTEGEGSAAGEEEDRPIATKLNAGIRQLIS